LCRLRHLELRHQSGDIALKRPLPPDLAANIMAYVGCIAGAVLVAEYERLLKGAGFEAVQVIDTGSDLNAYAKVENQSGCCSPTMGDSCCGPTTDVHEGLIALLRRYDVNDYAASVRVFALKTLSE
jgi:arsenite methyltransferase